MASLSWTYDAPYRWTVGGMGEAFLKGLIGRVLVGGRCQRCERVLLPPPDTCPRCAVPVTDAVEVGQDRKSTRLNSSHIQKSRMPSSA